MSDTELDSSELGTKSYWESTYKKEIRNFEEHGDPGEVWFGEDSASRVTDWIYQCGLAKDTAIVDIGCGNGHTLNELAREGFTELMGWDYCDEALQLARKVAVKEGLSFIKYEKFDITQDETLGFKCKFGLVHDKGTYDAVSLNPDSPKRNRESYIEKVFEILEDTGIFIITSCNWTEVELCKHFSEKFKLKTVIPTPQFKFGGKTGSMVSSVVFEKKL